MKYPMPFETDALRCYVDEYYSEEFESAETSLARCIQIVIDQYQRAEGAEQHFVNMCWLSRVMVWFIPAARPWYDQTWERLTPFFEWNENGEECIRVHRGFHKEWQGNPRDHIAWTLNYATAVFFAQRFSKGASLVATALIPMSKVVLTMGSRKEDEVLINTFEEDEEFFDYLSQCLANAEDVSIEHTKCIDCFNEITYPSGFKGKEDLGVTIGNVSYPDKLFGDEDYYCEE